MVLVYIVAFQLTVKLRLIKKATMFVIHFHHFPSTNSCNKIARNWMEGKREKANRMTDALLRVTRASLNLLSNQYLKRRGKVRVVSLQRAS